MKQLHRILQIAILLGGMLIFVSCRDDIITMSQMDATGTWQSDNGKSTIVLHNNQTFVGQNLPKEFLQTNKSMNVEGTWQLHNGNDMQKPYASFEVKKMNLNTLQTTLSLVCHFDDRKTMVFEQGDVDSTTSSIAFIFRRID